LSKISAAAAAIDVLDQEKVRYVFGIPGGPVLDLCDAIEQHPRINFILTKHEQAAAYAAFAYARVTGELGVCMSTLGPGATNLLSGLPVAAVESTPILAITGQVQMSGVGRGAHQESTGWFGTPDQQAIFRAVCKHSSTCVDPERIPEFLRHSIRIALSDRPGPVHLIVPSGLLHHQIHHQSLAPERYRLISDSIVDDIAAARIADSIVRSRRPALLMGGRSVQPDCGQAAQALSDLAAIPIASDLASKSVVDERMPLYLGCIGVLGHKAAENYLKEDADLIVSVGQTFDEISTLSWDPAFITGRNLVQLDVDAQEIGKAFPVADASIGHLPALLNRISFHVRSAGQHNYSERREQINLLMERYPLFKSEDMSSTKVPMLPQRVISELRAALPDNALILSDSSKWARWLGRYFQAARGQIVSAHDYEPMGWSVSGAIGAKLASPNRPVVCLCGDGAFLMSAMEVSTASNYGINAIWIVMNDSRLGIIYDLQKSLYGGRIAGTRFNNPDLVGFAESLGIAGQVISEPGELSHALGRALASNQSFLFDVRFDADEIPPVRPRSLLITKGMGLPDPTPSQETMRILIKLLKDR
jgi:acetolactate synthase I/II/III large subunit